MIRDQGSDEYLSSSLPLFSYDGLVYSKISCLLSYLPPLIVSVVLPAASLPSDRCSQCTILIVKYKVIPVSLLPDSGLVHLVAYGFEGNGYCKMLIKRTGNNIPVNVVSSFATSLRRGIIRERIQSCWGKNHVETSHCRDKDNPT